MGNVVVTEFVSLDGVFEDPGGAEGFEHAGWSFRFDRGEDGDRFKLDELNAADAHLLVRGLMAEDLVDEFHLMVFPIVLGSGRRLFDDGTTTTRLALTGTRQVGPDGVTVLTYVPDRARS